MLNESLRCSDQMYMYGARSYRKWIIQNLKYIFLDWKKVMKVAEEFFGVYCSKICVAFEKYFQSNSFIYEGYKYSFYDRGGSVDY